MDRGRAWRVLGLLPIAIACATVGPSGPRLAPIAVSERIDVDGAELFLSTRGADRDAPVLLLLHGGPGAAERALFRTFNAALEEHFVVAYLDQRGAGRSFDPSADPRLLTVSRHLLDLDVVVEHLRRSLDRRRVLLLGHSWGAALGLLYARAHPEKVAALAAVSPLVNTRAAHTAQYDFVRARARRNGDDDVLEELRRIGPPPHPTAAKALAMEQLADRYGGVFHRPPSRIRVVVRGLLRGLVTPREIYRIIRGNQVSLEAMHAELLELDLARSVPAVEVPVVFMLGRHDEHVSARVASDYFDALRAPTKQRIWFDHSAHNPPFEEPERFNAAVVSALATRASRRCMRGPCPSPALSSRVRSSGSAAHRSSQTRGAIPSRAEQRTNSCNSSGEARSTWLPAGCWLAHTRRRRARRSCSPRSTCRARTQRTTLSPRASTLPQHRG